MSPALRQDLHRHGPFYQSLLDRGLRALVYNGDVDLACSFLGGEKFEEPLRCLALWPYQPWYHDDQVTSFFQEYEQVTFLTMKGSGHMVPQYQPSQVLKIFKSFLSQTYT